MAEIKKTAPAPIKKTVTPVVRKTESVKTIVPLGIFILLFLSETLLCLAGTGWYFIHSAKKRIKEIEQTTRSYSITLAEAFADIAELGYRKQKYSPLSTLMKDKIQANTIDEAFFVLMNGAIVTHSNTKIEGDLKGNIANDELTYNLDLILKPARDRSRDIMFSEYNMIGKTIPFDRNTKLLIKQYVYPGITTTGWLISRAVFIKDKPVGTVTFLISKERVYAYLREHIRETATFLVIAVAISFLISLCLTAVLAFRYRSIQKKTLEIMEGRKPSPAPIQPPAQKPSGEEKKTIPAPAPATRQVPVPEKKPAPTVQAVPPSRAPEKVPEKEYITIELISDTPPVETKRPVFEEPLPAQPVRSAAEPRTREIKDAIPVKKA